MVASYTAIIEILSPWRFLTARSGARTGRRSEEGSDMGSRSMLDAVKPEKAFTKENAGKIELLYKYNADNQVKGLNALGTPLINGMLITYLGFKEMLVFGGSGDNAYSVDADLARLIWKVHFDYKADKP